jgi:hypothetical protein
MQMPSSNCRRADQDVQVFTEALQALADAGLPYLVGGTFAYTGFTGHGRLTKDLDVFIKPHAVAMATAALEAAGFTTHLPYPHWLAKAERDHTRLDLIFSSGNGVARVDDEWWTHAAEVTLFGMPVWVCPIEELIWSKSFVMERERYDGADVAHLIRARGHAIDWQRLRTRFGPYQLVLASHLLLFHFIYSDAPQLVPKELLTDVLASAVPPEVAGRQPPVCWGTLTSREQYLHDVTLLGYADARRVVPTMSDAELEIWTAAIGRDQCEDAGTDETRGGSVQAAIHLTQGGRVAPRTTLP